MALILTSCAESCAILEKDNVSIYFIIEKAGWKSKLILKKLYGKCILQTIYKQQRWPLMKSHFGCSLVCGCCQKED